MRVLVACIFTLFFSLNFLSVSAGGMLDDKSGWELIKSESGIQVYERWVVSKNKQKVRERSGEMVLNATKEEVLALISDVTKTKLWMQTVESSKIIKTYNEKEWLEYTLLDTPWPFSKQDMISKYKVTDDPSNKAIKVNIYLEPELVPKVEKVERMDGFSAEWYIQEIAPNKVRVTFTTISNRPPDYPCWMQDPVVRNIFYSNLRNFKKILTNA